ncbi:MAG: hypothetical protein DRN30_05005 [Thermoplasmata archaeon]|nr:MAG: hypothetical protein DRN30_05005 [Thermoplasmata archaeon]
MLDKYKDLVKHAYIVCPCTERFVSPFVPCRDCSHASKCKSLKKFKIANNLDDETYKQICEELEQNEQIY